MLGLFRLPLCRMLEAFVGERVDAELNSYSVHRRTVRLPQLREFARESKWDRSGQPGQENYEV